MFDTIKTEERDGFTIECAIAPEDYSPRGQFMNEDGSDDEEVLAKIASGEYEWFQVRVTALKAGIALGWDYLGGCCYASFSDFMVEDGYYADMVATAIDEAKATIAKLAA